MTDAPPPARPDNDLLARVEAALADDGWRAHPLSALLAELKGHCDEQAARLARLVRISDGYHQVSRNRSLSLAQQYDKQLRRLEKLARISDRYQNSLREMSEALREAALHDPLTGLGNRRYLMERLKEETERAQRRAEPYSIAILDVDHFKRINDRYGHDAGDRALCEVADAIRRGVREYDLCGRWGGEEFLIMLPAIPCGQAAQVIERVRANIEAIRLAVPGPVPALSASFGLTEYRPGEGCSDALNRADTALLRAKAAGRNCVQQA